MSNYRRDFTLGAIYFFTVVLKNRNSNLLMLHIDKFREAYRETLQYHPFKTIAITILPDHFHLLMQLPEYTANHSQRIKSLKTNFTKRLPKKYYNQTESYLNKSEAGIWQRRYWEHLIRDERDLNQHIDYIYYNPVKHGYVVNVKDWQYSSFHRDVRKGMFEIDWGSAVTLSEKQSYGE